MKNAFEQFAQKNPTFKYEGSNQEAYDLINDYFFDKPNFYRKGMDPNKGLLIVGSPGIGKTEVLKIVKNSFTEMVKAYDESLPEVPLTDVGVTQEGIKYQKMLFNRPRVFTYMTMLEISNVLSNTKTPLEHISFNGKELMIDDLLMDAEPDFPGMKRKWSEQILIQRFSKGIPLVATSSYGFDEIGDLGISERAKRNFQNMFNFVQLDYHYSVPTKSTSQNLFSL
jgi:hypothetical protein